MVSTCRKELKKGFVDRVKSTAVNPISKRNSRLAIVVEPKSQRKRSFKKTDSRSSQVVAAKAFANRPTTTDSRSRGAAVLNPKSKRSAGNKKPKSKPRKDAASSRQSSSQSKRPTATRKQASRKNGSSTIGPASSILIDEVLKPLYLLKHRNGQLLRRGSKPWIEKFEQIEKEIKKGSFKIAIHRDGRGYNTKIKNFENVQFFENKAGLGLEIPIDLSFATICNYIDPSLKFAVICSNTGAQKTKTIEQLVRCFDEDPEDRENTFNLLSLEFTQAQAMLDRVVKVPQYVRDVSIVNKLDKALAERLDVISQLLPTLTTAHEKTNLEKEQTAISKYKYFMPRYEKFLLLSMKGSFTDVHVDFSGTSVFYHVVKGRKVFYIADNTKENMEIYKKYELGKEGKGNWIAAELFKEWKRVEIMEGQTAMIPAGHLHFVYTPEDSVVIGGNFLMDQSLDIQFECTELEEKCVKAKNSHITEDNMFRGFRNVMWAYIEYVFLPQLSAAPTAALLKQARVFMSRMNPAQKISDDWYTKSQKEGILRKLRELMNPPVEGPKRAATSDGNRQGAKKAQMSSKKK